MTQIAILPRSLAAAAAALLVGCTSAAAQSAVEWPLDPTQESIMGWAGFGVIAAAAIAVAILIHLLAFRRRRLLEPTCKWLFLISLGVLPSFVLIGANGVILTESKTVEACGSCHVMKPFIEAMRDPGNDLLAAVHYKNRFIPDHQCYTCHSGYGIFGDVEAKAKGVGHLWKYWSDRYARPLRLDGKFDESHCFKCHAGSQRFDKVEAHQGADFWKDLKSGAATCFDCHGRAHPEFGK